MAMPSPSAVAISALAWLRAAMPPSVAKASVNRAKYSAGPNSSAMPTSCGARKTSPQVAQKAPTKEAMPEMARASPGWPFWVIGKPSSVVISAGSSPGMLSRIDEMRPPYMAP